jgi:hypothetical protein
MMLDAESWTNPLRPPLYAFGFLHWILVFPGRRKNSDLDFDGLMKRPPLHQPGESRGPKPIDSNGFLLSQE